MTETIQTRVGAAVQEHGERGNKTLFTLSYHGISDDSEQAFHTVLCWSSHRQLFAASKETTGTEL